MRGWIDPMGRWDKMDDRAWCACETARFGCQLGLSLGSTHSRQMEDDFFTLSLSNRSEDVCGVMGRFLLIDKGLRDLDQNRFEHRALRETFVPVVD